MELTFVKRCDKFDELTIQREECASETIPCPKQGIIPHDMVHYAVESVLTHQGFLSLVEQGRAAASATVGNESEEAIERLVEVFQAEMWGERVSAAEFLAVYEHACEARGHHANPVSPSDIDAIRARLDKLKHQWADVGTNEALILRF